MSEPTTTSAAAPDVVHGVRATLLEHRTSQASVFISQREVVFGSAAAKSPRPASISRRMIDGIRVAGATLYRPAAGRRYPPRTSYLELSRMAREMERL
jgi:hypothetical protein